MNYKKLAQQALQKALTTRSKAGLDLINPVSAYDICEKLKVGVKFVTINMEGTYVKEPKPRILISVLRPLARRHFTCGHELGHHVFGHGSTIDHLVKDRDKIDYDSPEEFLADSFSSFLLLPSIGIRRAFSSRGWNPQKATPLQIYTIACDFGVGYTTLVNHLSFSLRFISRAKAKTLLKSSPQSIREEILKYISSESFVIVDEKWLSATLDIEVGTKVLLPKTVLPSKELLSHADHPTLTNLFYAKSPGIVRVSNTSNSWAMFVRISPFQFEGLAKFRHLARDEEDED